MYKYLVLLTIILFTSCQNKQLNNQIMNDNWTYGGLSTYVLQQIDSTKWDKKMLDQDIELLRNFPDVFNDYPTNKSPFPVVEYEYAVSSEPIVIKNKNSIIKGYLIGEYENYESETIINKLVLLVLTNDENSEDATYVISRNYPYLTAEGYFKTTIDTYNWVFSSSPDGFSTLFINTKLFDLRFGKTIIIYPQKDGSIRFHQFKVSPDDYSDFMDFKNFILSNSKVKHQLQSKDNIQSNQN